MLKFFRLFWYLLNHPEVGKYKKFIFVGFPILYLIMPDLIPFMIDDLLVLLLGFKAFVKSAKNDVKNKDDDDYIDVEAKVIK